MGGQGCVSASADVRMLRVPVKDLDEPVEAEG